MFSRYWESDLQVVRNYSNRERGQMLVVYLLFGILATCGANPSPEQRVKDKLFESEETGVADVAFLTNGGCADLAVKYHHHPDPGPNHKYDVLNETHMKKTGTVLEVLEDFDKCLNQLNVLRHEALRAGQESAKWNEKAYAQYRDVVDTAAELDLDVGLEEAMAKQRKREAGILLKKMREVENKRRNLFSPLWQSVGLWQGFQPDPRMDAASRNLPYIGGAAPRTSTLDALINGLKSTDMVKVKREQEKGLDLSKKINALEVELQTQKFSTAEYKEKMRVLVTLKEIQDEQIEQDKHSSLEGLLLRSADSSKQPDLYHVYIRDFKDNNRKLLWRQAGVDWAKKKAQFSDLIGSEAPKSGAQVTGSQMVRCRKAMTEDGKNFSPTLLVGLYFKTERTADDELESEIQEEKRYRWKDVQGFRMAFPQCEHIAYSLQDGADVSQRTILAIKRQSGISDNIMADLVAKGLVNEIDRWGAVKTNSKYFWTAPGIAWCYGPQHRHMFPQKADVGDPLSTQDYDKLLTVYGDVANLEKAMCTVTPPLLVRKQPTIEDRRTWNLVDRWTAVGVAGFSAHEQHLRRFGPRDIREWPVEVDGIGKCAKPKVNDLYTKACDALITQKLPVTRTKIRDAHWLEPEAVLSKDISDSARKEVLRIIDPDYERQNRDAEEEANRLRSLGNSGNDIMEESTPVNDRPHNTAPVNYCGDSQNPSNGHISGRKSFETLSEAEKQDWLDIGFTQAIWDEGLPLSDPSFADHRRARAVTGSLRWESLRPQEREIAERLRFDNKLWDDEVNRVFTGQKDSIPDTDSSYCAGFWDSRTLPRLRRQRDETTAKLRLEAEQFAKNHRMGHQQYGHQNRFGRFNPGRSHGFQPQRYSDHGHGRIDPRNIHDRDEMHLRQHEAYQRRPEVQFAAHPDPRYGNHPLQSSVSGFEEEGYDPEMDRMSSELENIYGPNGHGLEFSSENFS